jgi:alcohol dehydrogenase class IV
MDFNLPAAADRLALIAEGTGIDTRGLSTEEAAKAAIKMVRRFVKDLGCPTRLRDVGVKESDLPPLAEAVMEEVPLMQNPLPIGGVDEILGVLRRAW